MKLLVLAPNPSIQGPLPKLVPPLNQALRDLGCEVLTAEWGRQNDHESLVEKIVGRLKNIQNIRRILRHTPVDAVLVHTSHTRAGVLRDIPLILSIKGLCQVQLLLYHGSHSGELVGCGRIGFKILSAIQVGLISGLLLLSHEEMREWRQFYPRGNYTVVPLPLVSAKELAFPLDRGTDDTVVVLFVGRLLREKGVVDLIEAAAVLDDKTPFQIVIAGTGPEEQSLSRLIALYGLRDRIELTGYVRGSDLANLYRRADIFVLPTYWSEGFPVVVMDAMYAGLPLITTRIRGMADHLEEGKHALFVPARDHQALADRLTQLIADPTLRARLGRANRETANEFALPLVADRYLRIIEDAVGKGYSTSWYVEESQKSPHHKWR